MTYTITEHFALEASAIAEDGTRRVRLISPGQGSSGYYSAEMLSAYTAKALPAGTLVYQDHTSAIDEDARGGTRSIRDVAGKIVTEPVYEANAPEGPGSYARVKFIPSVDELVAEMGSAIGVSIEVKKGKKDAKGRILEMDYHPLNSLAIVPVPGRDGRIVEDFREEISDELEEGTDMPISETEMAALADLVAERLKPAETSEPDLVSVIEKITKAELPTVLIPVVVEAVKSGKDVDTVITEQKAFVESVRGSLSEGVLSEDLGGDKKPKTDSDRGAAYMERIRGGKK